MSAYLLALSFPGPGGPVIRGKRMGVVIHFPVQLSLANCIFNCLRREHTGGNGSSYRDEEWLAVSHASKRTEIRNVEGLPGRELEDDECLHL